MNISLTEDVKTMTELESQPRKLVEQIHQTGRPIIVTKNGKPDLVILDAASYERHLKTANLVQLLTEGEADIKSGRTQAYEEFMKEFRRAKKIRG
jgi:prevent-host-death family protein